MGAETNIRGASAALLDAIRRGRLAGLSVQWPTHAEGLATIAISETAAAAAPGVAVEPDPPALPADNGAADAVVPRKRLPKQA